jgi:hypothetical protein
MQNDYTEKKTLNSEIYLENALFRIIMKAQPGEEAYLC